jgi:uncharacterized protein (DUF1800 family)
MAVRGVEAFVAVSRFGLGARAGELADAAGDPRGWLKAQLAGPAGVPARLAGLPPGRDLALELRRLQQARRKLRDDADAPRKPANGGTGAASKANDLQAAYAKRSRELYMQEATARALTQVESRQPLRERLVAFWANHFTVSILRPVVAGLAGAFEREAIRPRVTGRFHDLLLAVVRHPAMLLYLDNATSVGPASRFGRMCGRGLNENLARELLELHTLGVDGGYTQADVTAFARILTGWSIGGEGDRAPGDFMFRPYLHDPGEKVLLGGRYGPAGEAEGLQALAMLAHHPSTARHVARQFAVHFIADQPSAAAVARFERVFRDTDGDLGALARAAVDAPEAWAQPLSKVKTPNELVVATLRATGFEGDPKGIVASLRELGQLPFAAPSPAGWPDTAAGWIGPSAMLQRADFAPPWPSASAGGSARPTCSPPAWDRPPAQPCRRRSPAPPHSTTAMRWCWRVPSSNDAEESRAMLSRRRILVITAGGLAMAPGLRLVLAAAPSDERVVVVILRGAMDGLSACRLMPTRTMPAGAGRWLWRYPAQPAAASTWTAASGCIRRSAPSCSSGRRASSRSCMPRPPPTGRARISTARICWRRAGRATRSRMAGSTGRSPLCPTAMAGPWA